MEILIIGSNDRAGLTVVRALGQQGHSITVADFSNKTPASYSRYVNKTVVIASPYDSLTQSRNDLQRVLDSSNFNFVLPIDDAAIELTLSFAERIPNLALCDDEIYRLAANKFRIWELAQSLDVPVPEGVLLRKDNYRVMARTKPDEIVYCKPLTNVVIFNDRLLETNVKKCIGKISVLDFCNDYIHHCDVLMQKKVEGRGVGIYAIAREGEILYQTQQIRLHEPADGGGSSYRETTDVNPILSDYSGKIVRALNWTGPIMVEFKGDHNKFFLMETNGRFWGSLSLTVSSGYNYPAMLPYIYTSELERTAVYVKNTRVFRSRHLLKDIKWFCLEFINSKSILLSFRFFYDFRLILTKKEVFDVENFFDPKPMIMLYLRLLFDFFKFVFEKLRFYCKKTLISLFLLKNHKNKMLKKLQNSHDIAFICRGNINRSVFCEYFMKYVIKIDKDLNISSLGTTKHENRMASERIRVYCEQQLISGIENHKSRTINSDIINIYDIILALDFKAYYRVKNCFPEHQNKVYLLASTIGKTDIVDPHSKSDGVFEKSMNEIKSSMFILKEHLTT